MTQHPLTDTTTPPKPPDQYLQLACLLHTTISRQWLIRQRAPHAQPQTPALNPWQTNTRSANAMSLLYQLQDITTTLAAGRPAYRHTATLISQLCETAAALRQMTIDLAIDHITTTPPPHPSERGHH